LVSKEIRIFLWILTKSQSEINQSWAGPVDLNIFFAFERKRESEIKQSRLAASNLRPSASNIKLDTSFLNALH